MDSPIEDPPSEPPCPPQQASSAEAKVAQAKRQRLEQQEGPCQARQTQRDYNQERQQQSQQQQQEMERGQQQQKQQQKGNVVFHTWRNPSSIKMEELDMTDVNDLHEQLRHHNFHNEGMLSMNKKVLTKCKGIRVTNGNKKKKAAAASSSSAIVATADAPAAATAVVVQPMLYPSRYGYGIGEYWNEGNYDEKQIHIYSTNSGQVFGRLNFDFKISSQAQKHKYELVYPDCSFLLRDTNSKPPSSTTMTSTTINNYTKLIEIEDAKVINEPIKQKFIKRIEIEKEEEDDDDCERRTTKVTYTHYNVTKFDLVLMALHYGKLSGSSQVKVGDAWNIAADSEGLMTGNGEPIRIHTVLYNINTRVTQGLCWLRNFDFGLNERDQFEGYQKRFCDKYHGQLSPSPPSVSDDDCDGDDDDSDLYLDYLNGRRAVVATEGGHGGGGDEGGDDNTETNQELLNEFVKQQAIKIFIQIVKEWNTFQHTFRSMHQECEMKASTKRAQEDVTRIVRKLTIEELRKHTDSIISGTMTVAEAQALASKKTEDIDVDKITHMATFGNLGAGEQYYSILQYNVTFEEIDDKIESLFQEMNAVNEFIRNGSMSFLRCLLEPMMSYLRESQS